MLFSGVWTLSRGRIRTTASQTWQAVNSTPCSSRRIYRTSSSTPLLAASLLYSTSSTPHSYPSDSSIPRRTVDLPCTPPRQHHRCYSASRLSPTFKEDTIYALSTPHGRAGIAVIRVSGPGCEDVYRSLCPSKALPRPRYAAVRTLVDSRAPGGANVLDASALVLHFPGPKTVTGEDVLELHVHGGPATVKAVLAAIPKCATPAPQSDLSSSAASGNPPPGFDGVIRYAEPGEFTRRAFLNDRLDLAQVESLGDALAADTEQQRRAAVRGNSGTLGRTYETWRSRLLLARGEMEALIDFSEDQHFDESPSALLRNVSAQVAEIVAGIRAHEAAGARAELLRGGVSIALLGPPNAGKSSLMNLVVGREASIVSVEAGTTRDVVEASLDVRGYLCRFADTAGFRGHAALEGAREKEEIGIVEKEGIRRARQKALDSDIVVVMAAVEPALEPGQDFYIKYDEETLQLAAQAQASLLVVNKRDAVPETTFLRLRDDFRAHVRRHAPSLADSTLATISCKEAQEKSQAQAGLPNASGSRTIKSGVAIVDPGGIHAFIDKLTDSFAAMTSLPVDMQDLLGVTERQRQLLEQCRGWLQEYENVAQQGAQDEEEGVENSEEPDIVLAAEYLRYAADCLAKITGRGESGDTEEVLGVIFEK